MEYAKENEIDELMEKMAILDVIHNDFSSTNMRIMLSTKSFGRLLGYRFICLAHAEITKGLRDVSAEFEPK